MAGGLARAGKRVLLWLLTVRQVLRLMLDPRDSQRGAGVSYGAGHLSGDALDDVAGCEYVDDRIRLQE